MDGAPAKVNIHVGLVGIEVQYANCMQGLALPNTRYLLNVYLGMITQIVFQLIFTMM